MKQRLMGFPTSKNNLYERLRSGTIKQDALLKEMELLSQQEETVRRELADVFEQFDVQKKKQKKYQSVAGKYREEFEGIIYPNLPKILYTGSR